MVNGADSSICSLKFEHAEVLKVIELLIVLIKLALIGLRVHLEKDFRQAEIRSSQGVAVLQVEVHKRSKLL